jgi:hypothetical protein
MRRLAHSVASGFGLAHEEHSITVFAPTQNLPHRGRVPGSFSAVNDLTAFSGLRDIPVVFQAVKCGTP